jgi:hypothetical protein
VSFVLVAVWLDAFGNVPLTKANGSSWILESRLACTNVLQRVQQSAFSLITLLEAYLQVPLIGVLTGGIRAAGRNAWLSTVFSLLISVAFGVALGVLEVGRAGGPDDKLYGGLTIGTPRRWASASFLCSFIGLRFGGATYVCHWLLLTLVRIDGLIAKDLVGFLDYADSRVLLRRAGGGYLFVHHLMQDHFASRAQATRQT